MYKIRQIITTLLTITACIWMVSANALPRGSYKKTCNDCFVRHHRLHCECQDRNQFYQHTALTHVNDCNSIRNRNGHLVCHV